MSDHISGANDLGTEHLRVGAKVMEQCSAERPHASVRFVARDVALREDGHLELTKDRNGARAVFENLEILAGRSQRGTGRILKRQFRRQFYSVVAGLRRRRRCPDHRIVAVKAEQVVTPGVAPVAI